MATKADIARQRELDVKTMGLKTVVQAEAKLDAIMAEPFVEVNDEVDGRRKMMRSGTVRTLIANGKASRPRTYFGFGAFR